MANESDQILQTLLKQIHSYEFDNTIKIMNVCGGHERSISKQGIRSLLPDAIELIPGPGCPVCICPEEDIAEVIELAMTHKVTVFSYGDMLHVPLSKGASRWKSLQQAKESGADIRAISSPFEIIAIAQKHSQQPMVFFAIGFETTAAPTAAFIHQGLPDNVSVYLSAKQTWPAVQAILQSGKANFNGLIAPGHVASVMGADQWRFVVEDYAIPTAVAGFDGAGILKAIDSIGNQLVTDSPKLANAYTSVVTASGNQQAQDLMNQVFDQVDASWRGIGVIEQSGYRINKNYQQFDARKRYGLSQVEDSSTTSRMPKGCECAQVVLGNIYPDQCQVYGKGCRPESPLGPCMVSEEGACRIWWSYQSNKQKRRLATV